MGTRIRAGVRAASFARTSTLVVALIGAVTGCSSDDAQESSTYTVLEEQETDLGIKAVVSVKTDESPMAVIEEVFDEHDYVSVTMVCERHDLEEDGWVLQGTVEDGKLNVVVAYSDVVC